ncbi:glycoside hydrolase [Sistotremastrum niveocremeum HHB9708]|uniref:Beta-xylanase n=2 Tax=Sistotremastraceae TaxID=3402574 RepID=A0A164PN48_9AGAM|nr:glycoside hydrolase [Sistotremastrum niveocremeum HHB9708]KZT34447.1 glycoside hydrolase [Sistotremastrum suecicum HHB10207 ss-3]
MFASALTLAVSAASLVTGASAAAAASTLKDAASPLYFGAALGVGHLTNASDPTFAKLAKQQFSAATPENEMKWGVVNPEAGVYEFADADTIVAFTKKNNMKLRCHNLVWHSQLSPYVTALPLNKVKAAMLQHIKDVVEHFAGDCYAWDVINEPFNDDGTYRDDVFYQAMGEDYFEIALKQVRAYDSHAKLYINDYNIEGGNAKSDAMLALAKKLYKKGLLDGIGFESHFILNELPGDIAENMERFTKVGLDIAVTELDIRYNLPETATTDSQQATQYASVVNACQSVKRCVGITVWGITDLYSWIPQTFTGQGAALLWDDDYKKKPAYKAVINAFVD